MAYDLRPTKLKNNLVIKCVWNSQCEECLVALQDYSQAIGLAEIPEFHLKEFMAPAEWFDANEKLGCPHGSQKLLRSAYEKA